MTVARRWLCTVILPGRWWCRTWTCSQFSSFSSSACGWVSPFGALVFVESLLPAFCFGRVSSLPGRGRGMLYFSAVSAFFGPFQK